MELNTDRPVGLINKPWRLYLMRLREITESMGGTCSGGIATVAQPMGEVITRTKSTKPAKYANSAQKMVPVKPRKK